MSRTYIELCMKYDTCKRCPRNKICEANYRKQEEKQNATKAKGEKEKSNKIGVIKCIR